MGVLIPCLLGSIMGILAGLFPGFHTNLIAVIVAGLQLDVLFASVFLVAVAISRSIIDAVPTVFLGAAETENVMALLPAHRLLRKGAGIEAVKFFVTGSLLGIIASIFLIPLFIIVFPKLFSLLRPFLFWILLSLTLILAFRESWWWTLPVFILSGLLGILSLHSAVDPLFPLLSGLFGASGLFLSLFNNVEIPFQVSTDVLRIKKASMTSSVLTGVLAGSIVTLFPGMGPAQAAALAQVKRFKPLPYLVLVGALGTVDVLISLVTFFP